MYPLRTKRKDIFLFRKTGLVQNFGLIYPLLNAPLPGVERHMVAPQALYPIQELAAFISKTLIGRFKGSWHYTTSLRLV